MRRFSTHRSTVLLALCGAIAAGAAGCVFDKSGLPFSDHLNANQNGQLNNNHNGNENTNTAGCGDGLVDNAELCDDGNDVSGDGCDEHCTVEVGWQCTRDDPSVCTTVCGDGIYVAGQEACDDGNAVDGDGCSALCHVEDFYSCSGDPSVCACVVYVSQTGISMNPDGSSWSESYRSVQEGIVQATSLLPSQVECDVWVGEGTYFIYDQAETDTVTLQSRVEVYGGFTGVETARDQRDWQDHQTTLDGRHGSLPGFRVQHVVSANGVVGATLDGFTVSGGYISSGDIDGAGIHLVSSGVAVANCRILDNQNADDGGGIYVEGGSLLLTDSEITDNTSRDDGAGVVIRGVGSTATIRRCLFSGNVGGDRGGGLAVHDGIVTVENSVFWLNGAPNGGGASLGTSATVTFTNCTFSQNHSGASIGGGIRNDSSILTVTNSILWGDQPGELETVNGATTVTYSAVQSGMVFPGSGNINMNPDFVDDTVHDFHLSPGSPCIDAADSSAAPSQDLEYFARVDDPLTFDSGVGNPPVDMGAYEYQP